MIDTKKLVFESIGPFGMVNVTNDIAGMIRNGGIENGLVNICSHGSTTGVVLLGNEEGLEEDFIDMIKRVVPEGKFLHDKKTATDNGISHMRSSLVGSSVTIPFSHKRLYLGLFQQIYFVDFDFVSRERELIIQIMGE